MKNKKSVINLSILILSFFFFFKTNAQEEIDFIRIGTNDGLSESTIFSILQDHNGYMWFGTHDGLNKFDGYNFTVFKNIKGDSTSLSDNIVLAIYQSKTSNDLWVGTNDGGLSRFNYNTEEFISFKHNPEDLQNSIINNTVTNIVGDNRGLLWLGYNVGNISSLDPETGIVKNYDIPFDNNSQQDFGDVYLYNDSRNFLWICTKKGLYKFDKTNESFTLYKKESGSNSIPSDLINAIYEDKDYVFWISSEEGLIKFSPNTNEFKHFQNNPEDPFSISSNHVYHIAKDNNGSLWVGTRNGLNLFNEAANRFWAYKNQPANPFSISSNNISKLFIDNAGVFWVGTFDYGINKFDTNRKKFKHYKYMPSNAETDGLSSNTTRSVFEDQFGVLWIGYINGGITRFDREYNITEHFNLGKNTVTTICEDEQGDLWVGTSENGIIHIAFKGNDRNREIEHISYYKPDPLDPYSLSSPNIQIIYRDSKNRIWIGSDSGLDVFDRKNNRFKHFTYDNESKNGLSNLSVQNAILEDDDTIWVGTWNGLNKIMLPSDFDVQFDNAGSNLNGLVDFEYYFHNPKDINSLSDNRILSLSKNIDNTLWVGTNGGGLDRLEFLEGGAVNYTVFNEGNGLSNNVVYRVYNDENGNMWCSTNNGISQILYPSNEILHFTESDGLQGREFFWGAGWKGNSGEIFLGGSKGLNAFYPAHIQKNKYQIPVVLTNFYHFDKILKPDGKILQKNISEAEEINLEWGENVFSIEFSTHHFSAPKNIKYKYMLVGFDKDWITTNSTNRKITYTNLDSGQYEFRIKSTNGDGVWNENYKSLIIHIKPPFWDTLLFKVGVVALVTLLIYFVFLLRIRNLNKQRRNLISEVKERTKKIRRQKNKILDQNEELKKQNLNQVKLISILSHDLRSPLTTNYSILGLILDHWNEYDDNIKNELLNGLRNNSKTTLQLVDSALEFVSLKQNKIEPKITKKLLEETLREAIDVYSEQAKLKDLYLVFESDFQSELKTDHTLLRHILMNLISNAIKYSPKSKKIELLVETYETELKICVADQGIGIPEDKIDGLFKNIEDFGRVGTMGEKSHGIGLQLVKQYADLLKARIHVESRENEGSKFCLFLPLKWSD